MRKITKQAARAFLEGRAFKSGNTAVTVEQAGDDQVVWLALHGNRIAQGIGGRILATLAGWPTPTTRERLNGLIRLSDEQSATRATGHLYQHKGIQKLGGREVCPTEWFRIA